VSQIAALARFPVIAPLSAAGLDPSAPPWTNRFLAIRKLDATSALDQPLFDENVRVV
jgi:hypothetical protein